MSDFAKDTNVHTTELINRQSVLDIIFLDPGISEMQAKMIMDLPSAQTETCDGCKHKGKWENEVENGYNSPCTICKRRVNDNYER